MFAFDHRGHLPPKQGFFVDDLAVCVGHDQPLICRRNLFWDNSRATALASSRALVIWQILSLGVACTGPMEMEKIAWHLVEPNQSGFGLVALAFQAIRKGRNPRRCADLRNPWFEHQFKLGHYLPMPFCAALPNSIVKCWLCPGEPPFTGESTLGLSATARLRKGVPDIVSMVWRVKSASGRQKFRLP